jgi:hypothetical protein
LKILLNQLVAGVFRRRLAIQIEATARPAARPENIQPPRKVPSNAL